jgi:hypothetical protein
MAYVVMPQIHVSRVGSHGRIVLMVTSMFAVGFMSHDMESIVDHAGSFMGAAEIVTSWRISAIDRMYQVESVIDARRYTGRTLGAGMLWRGKIKRQFADSPRGMARRSDRRVVRNLKCGV